MPILRDIVLELERVFKKFITYKAEFTTEFRTGVYWLNFRIRKQTLENKRNSG